MVSSFLPNTASAIMSVTPEPIIWHPNHSPYLESNITFTKPSELPPACAFPDAEKGNLPTLISNPFSLA